MTHLRLTVDQENALRESTQTGSWFPQDTEDRKVAEYLRRRGLFFRASGWLDRGYSLTTAGWDWLEAHPLAAYDRSWGY